MYSPKYTITNSILKNIGSIEAAREVVENAPLIPAYEKQFQEDALIRTVHHGTHVEGNDLSIEQAERVILGAHGVTSAVDAAQRVGLIARERDIQEVINYRNVMGFIDDKFKEFRGSGDPSANSGQREHFKFNETLIKQIHKATVYRIINEESTGTYRKTQVVLRDSRTGEVTFRPPPAVEVEYLMDDFITWINSAVARDLHPVLRAGIAHYVLAAIHPFVEGNGRTARAFATLVLFVEGYDIKRLFSLEEYFDRDAESYYKSLIVTSNQYRELTDRDLTIWLEYFIEGLAIELTRVKEKVRKLSIDTRIKAKRGEQVALSERQIKLVEYLSDTGQGSMTELKTLLPNISEDTVLRELQDLVKKNIIRKRGKTKGSFYELVK